MNIPSKTDINGSDFNLEGEFEEIFNKSPVGIIIYDKKGKIMNLNKSALDIMGIPSLENVKGFSLFDNPYIADQKEKLQKEGSIKFQSPLDLDLLRALSFYNPTRSGVIFLDYMVSVTDSGYLVQIQDITKLKTADEINASEEKFCAIFDSMHESFMLGEIILDNERKPYDWVYISVNRAAASSYGMKPDEIENKRFRELFPDMEPPYLKEIGKAVLTGEIVKNMEMFSPITGNYIEVDIYPQNKGIFAVFTRIITERKRVENELKARNERYKHLVQHAPTGIYEMDYRGPKFKSVNDVMCQILGYTKEELLSMNPFDLLSDESKDLFKERIKKGLNGQKIDNSVDFKIKTKDGNEIWAALDIQLIYKMEI